MRFEDFHGESSKMRNGFAVRILITRSITHWRNTWFKYMNCETSQNNVRTPSCENLQEKIFCFADKVTNMQQKFRVILFVLESADPPTCSSTSASSRDQTMDQDTIRCHTQVSPCFANLNIFVFMQVIQEYKCTKAVYFNYV